ncbi:MAG: pyridoxal phosphate-dependent aminotransferase, partial [Phycisphaerales bacterium]
AELRRQGIDVLPFAAGEPDFDTPESVKRAAIEALTSGQTKYAPTAGDQATRKVIAEKLTSENDIPGCTPEHVVITPGNKAALFLAAQALLDPPHLSRFGGQAPEMILPVPAWVSFAPICELAGGKVVEVETTPATQFKMTPAQLRAAVTARTRIVLLNSPSNPCGTMYTPGEIEALCAVVAEAAATIAPQITILSDEMYEKIIFGGIAHKSPGSVRSVAERTITCNGLSKAFAMTGWRIGYLAGSGAFGLKVAKAVTTLQGQMTTCIPQFFLPAIRVALTQCGADVERMRQAFANRAELITGLMRDLPNLPAPRPTGGFFLFCDLSAHLGKTSPKGVRIDGPAAFAAALLDEHHMATVGGEDFGGCGRTHLRLSFACSDEQIREGVRRLGVFVKSLS